MTPSKPRKVKLEAVVAPETKEAFEERAKKRGMTVPELLRRAVLAELGKPSPDMPATLATSEDSERTHIFARVPRAVKAEAAKRAAAKGFAISRWAGALIQSHLTHLPVMSGEELAALYQSNRELAAIGRNINQIARVLNEAFHETERVRLDVLAELAQSIKDNRAAIAVLERNSRNSWRAD